MNSAPDILIVGGGIAGLWTFHRLRKRGFNVVLVEKTALGGGQTIASQGILHAGLKYALTGKINKTARNIAAMPDRWRAAMDDGQEVDLKAGKILTTAQQLLIPSGLLSGVTQVLTQKLLNSAAQIPENEWPQELVESGFDGRAVCMDELVLDIPSVVQALAAPYEDHIVMGDYRDFSPKLTIYTAAAGNALMAKAHNHEKGLKTQARPLLMAMLKPAPFTIYAHLVGKSEKPVATITTHIDKDGIPVWYIGGGVAERTKDSDPNAMYDDVKEALRRYMPALDFSNLEWAALPIDRIEGQSGTMGFMPDTPTIHVVDDHLYCWPTKLTFAPLLSDMILEHINKCGILPSNAADQSYKGNVDYAPPPWDKALWQTR